MVSEEQKGIYFGRALRTRAFDYGTPKISLFCSNGPDIKTRLPKEWS